MKYYSIAETAKLLNITAQTLRNWDRNGKLKPHHTTDSGYRYYSQEQLNRILGVKDPNRKTIGYCRVSSSNQIEQLEQQIQKVKIYLLKQGKPFEIITDIGSGIDYKKKGLKKLLKLITQNEIDKVVVLDKDRLLLFGFELVEYVASLYNCDIEIIDTTQGIEQQESPRDLIQIITVLRDKVQDDKAINVKKLIKELSKGDSN